MKKTSDMLFLFVVLLSVVSCSGKRTIDGDSIMTSSVITIDIENNLGEQIQRLNLSDVADSIEIIPLELTSKSMIKKIDTDEFMNGVGITDSDVVITGYRQMLHFSRKGKFLNVIGALGGGPEEYIDTRSFLIREQQREVYVMTGFGIKVYDFEGVFKRDASKQKHSDMFHGIQGRILSYSDFLFLNDKLPLDLMSLNEEFCSLALTDSLFNIQKKFFNPTYVGRYQEMDKEENRVNHYYFQNYWMEAFLRTDCYDGGFKLKYDAVDTIYQFHEDRLTFDPNYSLMLGKRPSFEMAHAWIKEPAFFNYLWIYDFFESKDYIHFLAGKGDMLYTVRYAKASREIRVLKKKSEIRERKIPESSLIHRRLEREFKLTNDLCGGGDFVIDFKSPSGYLISVNQPSDLLEKINIDDLKRAEVKDKAARDNLVQVLMNLSEDDNPVLIVAKLK